MKLTRYVIVATILAVAAYDIFAALHGGVEATVSRAMESVALAHPALPFVWGGLSSHLFLPRRAPLTGLGWDIAQGLAAALGAIAVVVDILQTTTSEAVLAGSPLATLAALLGGMLFGFVFFAQPNPTDAGGSL